MDKSSQQENDIMQDKIINIIENFDINDMDGLLNSIQVNDIDKKTVKRIKSIVNKKTGSAKKPIKLKFIVPAATFLLVITMLFSFGFNNIASAFVKLFFFMPGYGITDNNDIK